MVIRHHSLPSTTPLLKPSISKILVYRTSKDFDHCAELLRNILTVQESRRSAVNETVRKKRQASATKTRAKKQNGQVSLIKTNLLNATESARSSPAKVRKPAMENSPSKAKARRKSPSPTSPPRRRVPNEPAVTRSSSCGDLPQAKKMPVAKVQRPLLNHLTRIQSLSKKIQSRNTKSLTESSHLWHQFERSLSLALSSLQTDRRPSPSLSSIQDELVQLRKELRLINEHLHHFDHRDIDYAKKFDAKNDELLLRNGQLTSNSHLLQDRLDQLEKKNLRLIRRLTEQDLRLLSDGQGWISSKNRYLLLKEKLYHVYDDLTTLFARDRSQRMSIDEQKRQIARYKKLFEDLKQSAEVLLGEFDHPSIDEKVKHFLTDLLNEQQTRPNSHGLGKWPKNTVGGTSSSTIDDADSALTSIALHHDKRIHSAKSKAWNVHPESDEELEQISDLTSKLFSAASGDDDIPLGYSELSSSSSMPSDAERLLSM